MPSSDEPEDGLRTRRRAATHPGGPPVGWEPAKDVPEVGEGVDAEVLAMERKGGGKGDIANSLGRLDNLGHSVLRWGERAVSTTTRHDATSSGIPRSRS